MTTSWPAAATQTRARISPAITYGNDILMVQLKSDCVLLVLKSCPAAASSALEDTAEHGGTDTAASDVGSAAMTTANTVAATLFDAVEDSDSSASSDILQTSQVGVSDILVGVG